MKKRNLFKLAALTAVFALGSMFANAQNPTPVPAVKLIDNKGTIKYLQSDNGITTVSTNGTSGVEVTWKLGGTLIENTYIDVRGNVFGLDSIQLTTATNAATSVTLGLDHAVSPGSGWTLLVRNEATGAIEKMLATDMLQSGWQLFQISSTSTLNYAVTGIDLSSYDKVYVFRNGAKLIAGVDYTITGSNITLIPAGSGPELPGGMTAESYTLFEGDKIEVQFIK